MEAPFFSIIIPTYNRANHIVNTIDSVINQSLQNYELIIVNDGSTDNSQEVLEIYESNKKVKVITQENKERGAARNMGIKNSSGKYVVFLDSDDFLKDNHLETLHNAIIELKHPNFIATKFQILDEKGKELLNPELDNHSAKWVNYRAFLKGNFMACNYCVKRENPELKMFQEDRRLSIMEDWIFLLENLRNDKLYIIDNITIIMLDHQGRSMRLNHEKVIEKRLFALGWIKNNLNIPVVDKKRLDAFTYEFCSIHYFLGSKRLASFKFWLNSFLKGNWNKYMFRHFIKLLFLKTPKTTGL